MVVHELNIACFVAGACSLVQYCCLQICLHLHLHLHGRLLQLGICAAQAACICLPCNEFDFCCTVGVLCVAGLRRV